MRRYLIAFTFVASVLLLSLPSQTTALPGIATASAECEDGGGESSEWALEETFTDNTGRNIALRQGNGQFARIHIQARRGWPTGPDGTPVRQNTIDTLANPSTVEPQGTALVYGTPTWRVVVETGSNKGIITSYPILP